jgi:hypothetical protein
VNNQTWLAYAKNEIRKAQARMIFEFDESVSQEEREAMDDILMAENDYISFLRYGIEQIEGKSKTPDILDILKSRGKKFSRNN